MWLENEPPEPDLDMLDAEESIMAEDLYNQQHAEDFDQRADAEQLAAQARADGRHAKIALGIESFAVSVVRAQAAVLKMFPDATLVHERIRSRRSA